jgi:SPP1 gp7 family putative phage head morphogenesis protein
MRARKLRRPPRPASTVNLERSYYREIRRQLNDARRLVEAHVLPALPYIVATAGLAPRQDAVGWSGNITHIFDGMKLEYFSVEREAKTKRIAAETARDTAAHGRRQITRQIKAVLGVDPLLAEPWLQDMADAFVHDNVALIKTIPTRYFDEIEQDVQRGVRAGRRHEPMAAEIKARYGVSDARAKLIARDQVSKFNGDLNHARQTEMGIKRYTWATSGDERVRDGHADLDGKVFSWDDPPVVDEKTGRREHPGGDYQCRCVALPELSDIVEGYDDV